MNRHFEHLGLAAQEPGKKVLIGLLVNQSHWQPQRIGQDAYLASAWKIFSEGLLVDAR